MQVHAANITARATTRSGTCWQGSVSPEVSALGANACWFLTTVMEPLHWLCSVAMCRCCWSHCWPSSRLSTLNLPAAGLPDRVCLTPAVWQHGQPGAASRGSVSCLSPMSPLQGDNNHGDDRSLYAPGQNWLNQKHIMGRVVG